jgi:hypothetical protein
MFFVFIYVDWCPTRFLYQMMLVSGQRMEQEILILPEHMSHPDFIVEFVLLNQWCLRSCLLPRLTVSDYSFGLRSCLLPRLTASDYSFGLRSCLLPRLTVSDYSFGLRSCHLSRLTVSDYSFGLRSCLLPRLTFPITLLVCVLVSFRD